MISRDRIGRIFKEHGTFVFLLCLGLALRIAFVVSQGMSHDELSAWNRIGAYDFLGVLEYGVRPDMHPAFMQILLQYWVQVFGDVAWVFRLPSLIFGLASIVLIYHFACRFLSKSAGLFTSVLLLFLVFPIMHSTLARPYAPGLFFIVLLIYGIFKLEHSRIKKQYFWSTIYIVLGAVGAIYTHYYSGLSAGLIGLAALFYVARQRWSYLIGAGCLSLVLFLPHWDITKEHLSRDGLGWLGKPEPQWLLEYLLIFFNNNYGFVLIFIGIVLFLWVRNKFKLDPKSRFLLLTFFGVYFISHLVSLSYTPILREPGILMIFPLFLLGLGGLMKKIPERKLNAVWIGISVFLSLHSIFSSQLLRTVHFEPFREMTELVLHADEKYGEQNILKFCNVTNINYLNYYARNNGASLNFEMTLIEEIEEIHELARIVHAADKAYCMLARTNRAQNVIQLEIIRNHFPELVAHHEFFNANFDLWKRGSFENRKFVQEISEISHPTFFDAWNTDTTENEFIGDLRIPVQILRESGTYLLFQSSGWIDSLAESLNFVVLAERNGELLLNRNDAVLYQAWDQIQIYPVRGSRMFFTAVELPDKLNDSDVIHIYFWNRNFAQVKIEKPRIYVVQASH